MFVVCVLYDDMFCVVGVYFGIFFVKQCDILIVVMGYYGYSELLFILFMWFKSYLFYVIKLIQYYEINIFKYISSYLIWNCML